MISPSTSRWKVQSIRKRADVEAKIIEHSIPIGNGTAKKRYEVVYNAAEPDEYEDTWIGNWCENPDNLQLADMKPKVNYKAGADIEAAVKGASLSWTTEAETDENTVSDDDNTQTGGNGGGNNNPPSGELEG